MDPRLFLLWSFLHYRLTMPLTLTTTPQQPTTVYLLDLLGLKMTKRLLTYDDIVVKVRLAIDAFIQSIVTSQQEKA